MDHTYQQLSDGEAEDGPRRMKGYIDTYLRESTIDIGLGSRFDIQKLLASSRYCVAVNEFEIIALDSNFSATRVKEDYDILRSAISRRGNYMAYSDGNSVKLLDLDLADRPIIQNFQAGEFGSIFDLVFSDHHLITAHFLQSQGQTTTTIVYWRLQDFAVDRAFTSSGSPDTLGAILVNKSNTLLFIGGSSGEIKVWKYMTEDIEYTISGAHSGFILGLTMSKCEKYLVSCSSDHRFKVWDLRDYTHISTGAGHSAKVNQTTFSRDGKFLLACSSDGFVSIWDTTTWELVDKIQELSNRDITGIVEFQGDILIVSGNGVKRFRLSNRPAISFYLNTARQDQIECFIPCHDDTEVLYVASNRLYLLEENSNNRNIVPTADVKAVACLESLQSIVIALDNGNLRVYNTKTYESYEIDATQIGNTKPRCISLYNENGILRAITAGICSKVYRWNLDRTKITLTDCRVEELYSHIQESDPNFQVANVIFYQIDKVRYCISRDTEGEVIVFCITYGRKVQFSTYRNLSKYARCLAISNKHIIITGNENGIISLHNMSGVLQGELNQRHPVDDLAVTYDGRYLISLHSPNHLSHSILQVWSLEEMVHLMNIELDTLSNRIYVSDHPNIIVASDHKIFKLPNIFNASAKMSIYPFENSYIFARKIQEMLNNRLDKYMPQFNQHIIFPHKISMPHIYTFNNSPNSLNLSLRDEAKFLKSLAGETPLRYALNIRSRECVSSILKQAPRFKTDSQPLIYEMFEEHIFKINSFQSSGLSTFYQNCLKTVRQTQLPTSGILKDSSPVVHLSDTQEVQSDNFLIKSNTEPEVHQHLTFQVMRFKLNFTGGSQESLTFLRSLLSITDPEVLSTPAISAIVHYKWRYARKIISIFAIIDLTFLISYTLHVNLYRYELIPVILLFLFNTLFFIAELIQVIRDITNLSDYFSDFWNLNDLIRIIAFYTYTIWFVIDNSVLDQYPWIGFIVTIVAWIRLFSYFRLLDSTRYLINMLFEIIKDMLPFFAILISANAGFGLLMHQLNPKDSIMTVLKDTYKIAYQDFETSTYDDMEWVWFLLISIINPLIMLNLLIAIMGDTYDRVKESQNVADIQELLNMILETESYLIWNKNAGNKSYLQVCYGSDDQNKENSQTWKGKIKAINTQIKSVNTNIENLHLQFESLNKNLSKLFKEDQDVRYEKLKSYLDRKFTDIESRLTKNP
jgi:WD40 repeat protein